MDRERSLFRERSVYHHESIITGDKCGANISAVCCLAVLRAKCCFVFTDSVKCVCPVVVDPVCGIDGVTYDSACHAECKDVVDFKCANSCDKCDSKFPKTWITHAPYIAEWLTIFITDGTIASGNFDAHMSMVSFPAEANTKSCLAFVDSPKCVCPETGDPVCGIDGVTYNSICHAKCNNVADFKCANSCDKCDSKFPKTWITHAPYIA